MIESERDGGARGMRERYGGEEEISVNEVLVERRKRRGNE